MPAWQNRSFFSIYEWNVWTAKAIPVRQILPGYKFSSRSDSQMDRSFSSGVVLLYVFNVFYLYNTVASTSYSYSAATRAIASCVPCASASMCRVTRFVRIANSHSFKRGTKLIRQHASPTATVAKSRHPFVMRSKSFRRGTRHLWIRTNAGVKFASLRTSSAGSRPQAEPHVPQQKWCCFLEFSGTLQRFQSFQFSQHLEPKLHTSAPRRQVSYS